MWKLTGNVRWWVDNKSPEPVHTLQQEWTESSGLSRWTDIPIVFAVPMKIRDTKS